MFSSEDEDNIAKNGALARHYIYNVLKAPFPKGEDIMAKNDWAREKYMEHHNLDFKDGKFHEKDK